MRIALVGLGDIAQKAYLPLVSRHLSIEPVLCTRNAERLASLSRQYRISETYSDYSALLASRPRAVMLHSSTDAHFSQARQALEQGIAVFVDKPLSYHLSQTEHLIELSLARNVPLFCGFNRRYAPLYQSALEHTPVSVLYQKNRFNQAAQARAFIYDDFIHVLDFVRFVGGMPHGEPAVMAQWAGVKLGSVQVSWASSTGMFTAAMNRLCGQTFERLDYSAHNRSWHVENLRGGMECQGGQSNATGFGDWQDTLYKRGFPCMLEAFLQQIQQGGANKDYLQGVLDSHRLCETLLHRLGDTGN
ncbi:Gfo/Idh/MocA family protein [Gilvimarinus xylanilyticus]|uniref:Gfo/Idh/MocA family oxidoreductase n=1 Tax=Gilvimarinus xylanilyticus TaxID=2944139 RepID=A0A9X2I1P0_9GAMM|nr:Gfo/Idh/MocA family oxidoreductase [Gilvimarinus xylanilyticus]MCP8897907.1 Gfo/Idh/MocA family oxidoreductase [Gilvimarinus xylanilyticus]